MQNIFLVHAEWDTQASVWVATSDDVPGLATEGGTLGALSARLERMVPDLLDANAYQSAAEVSFELLARKFNVTQWVTT